MELRRHCLILLAFASASHAAPVRTYPLDARAVVTIAVGCEEPTTCVFPGALTALETAGISVKPEDQPPVLLSYSPGAPFFSVRALRADAKAAINVVFHGQVFALRLVASEEPDRTVNFQRETISELKPEKLRTFVTRAKHLAFSAAQHPAVAVAVEHRQPGTVTAYRDFAVTLEDVFRFDEEDVLVCHIRLVNEGGTAVTYAPDSLGLRVDHEVRFSNYREASGVIPPRATTWAWLAVAGDRDGTRANIPVTADFTVLVSS